MKILIKKIFQHITLKTFIP